MQALVGGPGPDPVQAPTSQVTTFDCTGHPFQPAEIGWKVLGQFITLYDGFCGRWGGAISNGPIPVGPPRSGEAASAVVRCGGRDVERRYHMGVYSNRETPQATIP